MAKEGTLTFTKSQLSAVNPNSVYITIVSFDETESDTVASWVWVSTNYNIVLGSMCTNECQEISSTNIRRCAAVCSAANGAKVRNVCLDVGSYAMQCEAVLCILCVYTTP